MALIKTIRKQKAWTKIAFSLVFFLAFGLVYALLRPAFWNFVILPNVSSDTHGFRVERFKNGLFFNSNAGRIESSESFITLDRPEHSALAFAVWEVPVSGRYRLLVESDSTCSLYLDGKTALTLQGFHPQNGDGVIQYLEKGLHLLLFKIDSGPNKGSVDFKIQPPGEKAFSRIAQRDLRQIKFNNFPEWWNFILFFKGALIIGLSLILLFLWWPELSSLLRSKFLLVWLTNRNALIWIFLGLLMLLITQGTWPFLWKYYLLPRSDFNNHGMQVNVFAGKEMAGNPVNRFTVPSTSLSLEEPQSSLQAYAVWQVPRTGNYTLTLSCRDHGSISIDEQSVISFSEGTIAQTEKVPFYLTQGPHLLRLQLTSSADRGSLNLSVSVPGSAENRPLSGQELTIANMNDIGSVFKAVRFGKYLGLIGLSFSLILLLIRLGNLGGKASLFMEQAPLPFYAAGFSMILALSLVLRIFFLVDLEYPALNAKWVAFLGLVFSFGAIGGAFAVSLGQEIKNEIPKENNGSKGVELICLMAVMSVAIILRVLFLQNMEYKTDESQMVHMAINLGRDHIPYVVGNLTSHGNRNPPGLLYLISLPAFISTHPIHITFVVTFINILAVFITYRLVRHLLGWRAATVAALLFACSPWAIRCSMKVWPCNVVIFFAICLCFLMRTWYEKGGWWRSTLVGVCASMLAQLHFSSLLLLFGICIFSLVILPKIPWKRLPVAFLAFVLLWLPYIYYQAKQGPDSGHIIKRYLKELPGGNLDTLRNVYWEVGGFFLDSDEAIGDLGKEFRASVWKPIYGTFHIWVALVLFGLFVFEFRPLPNHSPPDARTIDWLKLFIWAVIFTITAEIMMNVRADMSYVEFVFPWPFVLVGLWVHHLEQNWASKRLGKRLLYVPFIIVLIISAAGSAYFWSWQDLLGRTGGGGEYGPVFYRQEAAEINYIKTHRPLPDPLFGPETIFSW
jgi:Ca2+/Na+ antiporter